MSPSGGTEPVDRPASGPAEPGGRSGEEGGDPGGETAGGLGGEAAGSLGREPAPDRSRAPGRGLAAYLLLPRPDAWAKALIAPACFLLAASAAGHLGNWEHFLVLWLVLEYLVYAARYQWNDIRGIEEDLRHAETHARSRLPVGTTALTRRRAIRLSLAVAVLRVSAALSIGAVTGLVRQVLLLTGSIVVIAWAYEVLRDLPAKRSRVSPRVQAVAVWLVVGLGYLVRGALGLGLSGLAWGSLALVAGLACVMSFGIMFVLLTWVLEATSYCEADARGGWHGRPALAAKPHLATLLAGLGRPILGSSVPFGQGRYCGADRVLRRGGRLAAPWNLALLAAVVSGAAEGIALARPRAGGPGASLAAALVSVAGAVLLARCGRGWERWITAAAGVAALTGVALLAHAARPVPVALPWLAIASVYSAFHGWSYRDLVETGPRLAAALRKAAGPAPSG
jgi:hypothetical protein